MRTEILEQYIAAQIEQVEADFEIIYKVQCEESIALGETPPTLDDAFKEWNRQNDIDSQHDPRDYSANIELSEADDELTRKINKNPIKHLREWVTTLDYSRASELNSAQWLIQLASRDVFEDTLQEFFYDRVAVKCALTYLEDLEGSSYDITDTSYQFFKEIAAGNPLESQLSGNQMPLDPFAVKHRLRSALAQQPIRPYTISDDLALASIEYETEDRYGISGKEVKKAFPNQSPSRGNWGAIKIHRFDNKPNKKTLQKLDESCEAYSGETEYWSDNQTRFKRMILEGGHRIVVNFSAPDDIILDHMKKFLKSYRKNHGLIKPKTQVEQLKQKLISYKVLQYLDLDLYCLAYRIKISDRLKAELIYGKDISDTRFNQTIKPFIKSARNAATYNSLAHHIKEGELD